tara:strand:+ start:738 stop:1124 length:387 start_codon:yes stop_codon:yes gene_type:complete
MLKDEYKQIIKSNERFYGKHTIMNCSDCNISILKKDHIVSFIKDLVFKIDMVAFGDAIVERFGEGIEVGISAVQLIETSAITIHTNDMAKDLYLDVFSCKDYDEKIVNQVVNQWFNPKNYETNVFYRK